MKSTDHIFLIGFSGSGKSTMGEALAKRLKMRFFDTDRMIAERVGKSISQIFAEHGEKHFRMLEHRSVVDITKSGQSRMVVALGGGAFQDEKNRKLIAENGLVVYLSCSQKELFRRLRRMEEGRPMLEVSGENPAVSKTGLRQRIKQLTQQRRPHYNSADIRISTSSRSVSETVRQLIAKIRQFDEHH